VSAAQVYDSFDNARLLELGLLELGVRRGAESLAPREHVLDLDWPELSRALPDGGLPRGVTEIAAPHAHGGGTTLALAACRAAQRMGEHVHVAWIEASPGPSLYAPEARVAGVDLARLFVVRAPREALARVCVKTLASGAFALVVVAPSSHVSQAADPRAPQVNRSPSSHVQHAVRVPRERGLDERAVRRFALGAEESGARVLLLTDSYASHVPWPVSLRLEVERLPEAIHVRVARDRRGREGATKSVPLHTRPHVASDRLASLSAPLASSRAHALSEPLSQPLSAPPGRTVAA
jgi:hypothetical protein